MKTRQRVFLQRDIVPVLWLIVANVLMLGLTLYFLSEWEGLLWLLPAGLDLALLIFLIVLLLRNRVGIDSAGLSLRRGREFLPWAEIRDLRIEIEQGRIPLVRITLFCEGRKIVLRNEMKLLRYFVHYTKEDEKLSALIDAGIDRT